MITNTNIKTIVVIVSLVATLIPGTVLPARARDTRLRTNTNLIGLGDAVSIDLMLGNHGNQHRDFKLASQVDVGPSVLTVTAPDSKRYDLKDRLIDTGYTPKEGFWTTTFAADKAGLYEAHVRSMP